MNRRDEGYALIHVPAAWLREERKLWPQNLTDVELEKEYATCNMSENPISYRMLHEELRYRETHDVKERYQRP